MALRRVTNSESTEKDGGHHFKRCKYDVAVCLDQVRYDFRSAFIVVEGNSENCPKTTGDFHLEKASNAGLPFCGFPTKRSFDCMHKVYDHASIHVFYAWARDRNHIILADLRGTKILRHSVTYYGIIPGLVLSAGLGLWGLWRLSTRPKRCRNLRRRRKARKDDVTPKDAELAANEANGVV